tara:strand:- start:10943 stop:11356 length:414 start_codon:yes stop_codon:yes gene_type:complete
MSSPDLQHIPQVYNERIRPGKCCNPRSVSPTYFESAYLVLSENGQTTKIRMVSNSLPGVAIWLDWRIGDESEHAVRRNKMTGESVLLKVQTQGQTFNEVFADTAKLLQIGFACLAEPGVGVRPLVRPMKDMMFFFRM